MRKFCKRLFENVIQFGFEREFVKKMDAIQIELLEEYKYVDAICRDMLGSEKRSQCIHRTVG